MWKKFSEEKPRIGEMVVFTGDSLTLYPVSQRLYNPIKNTDYSECVWCYHPNRESPWLDISWRDLKVKITSHFTVHEAIWLPFSKKYHIPSDDQAKEIYCLCLKLELLRELLGEIPFIVHSFLRSPEHNKLVGGVKGSYHTKGMAVDGHFLGYATLDGCAIMRKKVEQYLELLELRLERDDGKARIHLDSGKVKNNRYFLP